MNDTQILNKLMEMFETNTNVHWYWSETTPADEFEAMMDFVNTSREVYNE